MHFVMFVYKNKITALSALKNNTDHERWQQSCRVPGITNPND